MQTITDKKQSVENQVGKEEGDSNREEERGQGCYRIEGGETPEESGEAEEVQQLRGMKASLVVLPTVGKWKTKENRSRSWGFYVPLES